MNRGHRNHGRGCCDRLRLRHFIADGHRASDRRARTAPIRKKIEWRLCPHFLLTHHVRKNLERRASALLSAKSEYSDERNSGQQENKKKSAQHIYSSWTMVMCCPPVFSSRSRASISVKRGSRASMTRKNPSLVARLNRSQLNSGWFH